MARIEVTRGVSRLCGQESSSFLAAAIIFLTTFCIILPSLCQHWVFSKYFRGVSNDYQYVKKAVSENSIRLKEAEDYFKDKPRVIAEIGGHVDVAIGIISINRATSELGKLGYLTQVAAKLHELTQVHKHMGVKKLFICNVDAVPQSHTEAVFLSQYIHMVSRFTNSSELMVHSRVFEKEKQDYAYCMSQALGYNPIYILMVEDDAIPNDNVFQVLEHTLQFGVQQTHTAQDEVRPGESWLFLKLYYPEKWQGYSNDMAKIAELVGIAILGGSIFSIAFPCILELCAKKKYGAGNLRSMIHFTLGAAYFVMVAYTVGRAYIQRWRYMSTYTYHLVDAPDCCTQGILYPAHASTNLIHYLNSVMSTIDFSVDLAIDKYADLNDLKRHLVEPNLMQHIGLVSTVREYAKGAAEFIFS